jgi:hypothetical protein
MGLGGEDAFLAWHLGLQVKHEAHLNNFCPFNLE